MKTKYLDTDIDFMETLKRRGELSFFGSKKLEEYKEIKSQLIKLKQ